MSDANSSRDLGVDRLRGLSVVFMLFANIAPITVPEPRPFAYRALTTFCAPTFVLLFGMMLGRRQGKLNDALKRGVAMLFFAASLDALAWGLVPFVGFDILYLLGCATPLVVLATPLPPRRLVLLALALVLIAPLLRDAASVHALPEALRNALVFGWFPLLPWLGVALFGAALGKLDSSTGDQRWPRVLLAAAFVAIGALEWSFSTTVLREKGGYAELFYPPLQCVLAVFVGLALGVLEFLRAARANLVTRFLERFGRRSLWVYVVHILLIGRVIHPLVKSPSWWNSGLAFFGLLVVSDLSLRGLEKVRPRSKWTPLKLLLGS